MDLTNCCPPLGLKQLWRQFCQVMNQLSHLLASACLKRLTRCWIYLILKHRQKSCPVLIFWNLCFVFSLQMTFLMIGPWRFVGLWKARCWDLLYGESWLCFCLRKQLLIIIEIAHFFVVTVLLIRLWDLLFIQNHYIIHLNYLS